MAKYCREELETGPGFQPPLSSIISATTKLYGFRVRNGPPCNEGVVVAEIARVARKYDPPVIPLLVGGITRNGINIQSD